MRPAEYYRQNKTWKNYLGKTGKVVVATIMRVSAPAQEAFLPYSYAVVKFSDNTKAEFMGAANETLKSGDKVKCVLRKTAVTDSFGIIEYVIKVTKV